MSIEKRFLESLEKHKNILFKVANIYMDNEEDRADLRQEILIQLWKSYPHFQEKSAFSTWMYRVAINTAITYFKADQKKPYFSNDQSLEISEEPLDTETNQQLEVFYKAVQELNPVDKALIFYYMEGLNHAEIGHNLGISEGNVRVRLNRSKIQEIVKKYGF